MLNISKTEAKIIEAKTITLGTKEKIEVGFRLKIDVKLPNTVLNQLEKGLTESLYTNEPSEQLEMEVSEVPLAFLKFKEMNPITWNYKGIGYKIVLFSELKQRKNIELEMCAIESIKITPHQGGSVELQITIKTPELDEKSLGRICIMGKTTIDMELTPPSAELLENLENNDSEE